MSKENRVDTPQDSKAERIAYSILIAVLKALWFLVKVVVLGFVGIWFQKFTGGMKQEYNKQKRYGKKYQGGWVA